MKPLRERLSDRSPVSQGTYATCFRARDEDLKRPVFLKLLNPVVAKDREMRQRFEREAQAVARLSHPYLVRLLEFGEDPVEGMYMLLEWVEGVSLHDRLQSGCITSSKEIRTIAEHLLTALDGLHSVGVIHRDIKPENILLCADGSCKVTDFSLAALTDSPRLTHHQAVVGTPAYMSPEQAAGKPLDARSDLFSIGVVLYEAAIGANPFLSDDLIETLRRIRSVHPPFAGEAWDSVPRELHELIVTCLAKKPSDRPENARAALALLKQSSRSPSANWRSRRLHFAVISVLLFLGAFSLAIFSLRSGQRADTPENLPHASQNAAAESTQAQPDTFTTNSMHEPVVVETNPDHPESAAFHTEKTTASLDSATLAYPLSESQTAPDSIDVYLDVRPWAQISANGLRLGTTPLRKPLRMPPGKQTLTFYNPAYPSLDLTFTLADSQETLKVDFGLLVTTLEFDIDPWGIVFVDGESYGPTPFNQDKFVMPGSHRLRIAHPSLSSLEREFICRAGDSLVIRANMDSGELSFNKFTASGVSE